MLIVTPLGRRARPTEKFVLFGVDFLLIMIININYNILLSRNSHPTFAYAVKQDSIKWPGRFSAFLVHGVVGEIQSLISLVTGEDLTC